MLLRQQRCTAALDRFIQPVSRIMEKISSGCGGLWLVLGHRW
jgi:hypothetical protein